MLQRTEILSNNSSARRVRLPLGSPPSAISHIAGCAGLICRKGITIRTIMYYCNVQL